MSNLVITYTKRRKRTLSASSSTPFPVSPKTCVFCLSEEDNEDEYGKLITKCGITVHYFCMLFASGLCQSGKRESNGVMGFLLSDIKKELKRGSRLRCSYCKEKGTTIGCVVSSCRKMFHLTCGRKLGTLHQFYDSFRSFCPEHRPQQSCKVSDRLAFYGTANTVCSICMYAVEARSSNETLRTPCCKNAWFHRTCIQKYAVSAGKYFFKCPLCNNKDLFQAEMLQFGIYVPDQDASWEKEPGAFDDLSRRYTHCDAVKCICPEGRSYDLDESKWEIVVCELCGSVGSHKACHGLKKRAVDFVCFSCQETEQHLKEEKKKKKMSRPKIKKGKKKAYYKSPQELDQLLKRRAASLSSYCGDETPKSSKEKVLRKALPIDVVRVSPADEDVEVDVVGDNCESCTFEKPRRKRLYPKLCTSDIRKHQKKKNPKRLSMNSKVKSTSVNSTAQTVKPIDLKNYVSLSTITNADINLLDMCRPKRSFSKDLASSKEWAVCDPPLPMQTSVEVENSESDMCSIASVEEDGTTQTVTIKWRGRKIKIFKELEQNKHNSEEENRCEGTSKMSLVMEVDNCDSASSSRNISSTPAVLTNYRTRSSSLRKSDVNDTPPQLIPVDEEISVRSTPKGRRTRRHIGSIPAKLSSSSLSDGSDFDSPPILSPVIPYKESSVEVNRMTRSMDRTQKYQTRLCASDFLESLKSPVSSLSSGHARRSLEKSFAPDNCKFAFPNVKTWKSKSDADSESTLSCPNSVISLSSNGEEGTVDYDSDCQVFDASPCIIASEKTANRVSLSARIDIGNTGVRRSVCNRSIQTLCTHGNEVIDLTDC